MDFDTLWRKCSRRFHNSGVVDETIDPVLKKRTDVRKLKHSKVGLVLNNCISVQS